MEKKFLVIRERGMDKHFFAQDLDDAERKANEKFPNWKDIYRTDVKIERTAK